MKDEYLQKLIALGYADEAGVAADVSYSGGSGALCVNGELVTLAHGDPPEKVFKDSIDKLQDLEVKSGLLGSSVCFTHNGEAYKLKVKKGKTLVEYFKLIG